MHVSRLRLTDQALPILVWKFQSDKMDHKYNSLNLVKQGCNGVLNSKPSRQFVPMA